MARIISIGGGKGGTGKSSIAVNLAFALAKKHKVLLVDNDVESPLDHIYFNSKREIVKEITSFLPKIDEDSCIRCNICVNNCPEHALIGLPGNIPKLIEDMCDGCKICYHVCPVGAISDVGREIGEIYAILNQNPDLVQGEVKPGVKQHSNIAVSTIRYVSEMFQNYDYVIIDSAPGTGAGVWISMIKAQLVVAVTEPTPLGLSDFKRYKDLVEKVNKEMIVVINKADVPGGKTDLIHKIASNHKIFHIPYDPKLMEAYIKGKPVVDEFPNAESSKAILELKNYIENNV
ncbi:MAG: P-loop NTPase [Candidatus Njordarchaeia archaeon]